MVDAKLKSHADSYASALCAQEIALGMQRQCFVCSSIHHCHCYCCERDFQSKSGDHHARSSIFLGKLDCSIEKKKNNIPWSLEMWTWITWTLNNGLGHMRYSFSYLTHVHVHSILFLHRFFFLFYCEWANSWWHFTPRNFSKSVDKFPRNNTNMRNISASHGRDWLFRNKIKMISIAPSEPWETLT